MAIIKVTTPEFRVSYPKVFKPELNKLSKQEEYSLVALFPKGADLSKLKKACQQAVEEKWGKDSSKWPKNLRLPIKDQSETRVNAEGETVANAGHVNGAQYVNLKSKQRPGVVDRAVQPILSEADFYAGCYAIATVTVYAYDQAGNRGIAFGLQNIQKTREGEPLSGRMKAEQEFAPIEGAASDFGPVESSNDLFK